MSLKKEFAMNLPPTLDAVVATNVLWARPLEVDSKSFADLQQLLQDGEVIYIVVPRGSRGMVVWEGGSSSPYTDQAHLVQNDEDLEVVRAARGSEEWEIYAVRAADISSL